MKHLLLVYHNKDLYSAVTNMNIILFSSLVCQEGLDEWKILMYRIDPIVYSANVPYRDAEQSI